MHRWPSEFAEVRALLARAAFLAKRLERPEWDFAVEIEELLSLGLSRADLRWLVCQGFLAHAVESAAEPGCSRRFRPGGELTFGRNTCFILTELGQNAELERTESNQENGESGRVQLSHSRLAMHRCPGTRHVSGWAKKPNWDSDLKLLTLGNLIVKEFRTPAPNQQLVLAAFQESHWPARIDDPLPPVRELNSKRRLVDTIASLNRGQQNQVLRFSGDGSGLGVIWTQFT